MKKNTRNMLRIQIFLPIQINKVKILILLFLVTLCYDLQAANKSLILHLIFMQQNLKMSEIIKKLMDKLSFEDDEKLTSEEVIEMENTYGAHK